jgi:hypothetical protein
MARTEPKKKKQIERERGWGTIEKAAIFSIEFFKRRASPQRERGAAGQGEGIGN